jgi:hypothetical protein
MLGRTEKSIEKLSQGLGQIEIDSSVIQAEFKLKEAFPLCVQNRYRKIRRTQQEVIYCYTGQLVSTQLWGRHQASD